MALIIRKAKKFLSGHSYATGFGYKFHWTPHAHLARRFGDCEISRAEGFAHQTKGKLFAVPNSRKELKAKGRVRLMYPNERYYNGPYGSISAPAPV